MMTDLAISLKLDKIVTTTKRMQVLATLRLEVRHLKMMTMTKKVMVLSTKMTKLVLAVITMTTGKNQN